MERRYALDPRRPTGGSDATSGHPARGLNATSSSSTGGEVGDAVLESSGTWTGGWLSVVSYQSSVIPGAGLRLRRSVARGAIPAPNGAKVNSHGREPVDRVAGSRSPEGAEDATLWHCRAFEQQENVSRTSTDVALEWATHCSRAVARGPGWGQPGSDEGEPLPCGPGSD